MSKTVKPQFTHKAAADFNTDVFIGFYRFPSSLFHIWPQIILNIPKSHELQLFFTSRPRLRLRLRIFYSDHLQ